eukprot:6095499-Alexandrium_andersonii.AAC.1
MGLIAQVRGADATGSNTQDMKDGVKLLNDLVWTLCLACTVLWVLFNFGGLDQHKVRLGQCKVVVEKKNVAVQ